MPFIPAPDIAQVELRMLWDNQRVENTLYVNTNGLTEPAILYTIGGEFLSWWTTEISPLVSNTVSLREVYVRLLTTQFSSATSTIPVSPPTGGVSASPPLPNNVSCAISFRTTLPGRAFRGRNYIVGLCESQVTGNNIASSLQTAYIAAYGELASRMTDIGCVWGVLSRYQGNAPRVTGQFTPINFVSFTDSVIDSQRRRLPTRGT